jgi:antitoxin component of MazEF toxin-antitoxin module
VVAVVRHTATLGRDGDLRIPREIREAAHVVDGEQLTIEVADEAAIVIRHADRRGGDVADALSRAAGLRARVAETRSSVGLVREGRDELEGRTNVSA